MKIAGIARILLNEADKKFQYNIVPVGKFFDPRYEWLEFSEERLKKIVENFKKGIPSYSPPLNIEHNGYAGKYGEIKDAWIDGGLIIEVECSEEGWNFIKDKKFEYMSVEINDYFDKEKGESVGEVLTGAALTNKPANPFVSKIELSEEEVSKIKSKEGQQSSGKDGQPSVSKQKEEITMTPEEIAAMQAENEKLKKEKAEADKKAIELAEENKKKDVENKKKEWKEKGIPPVIADMAGAIILSEKQKTEIKLSDTETTTVTGAVEKMMDSIAKIDFTQYGKKTERDRIKLSDDDMKELDATLGRLAKKQ